MTRRTSVTLILVTALAALLRFYQVTVNPPNINTDEAAIGYNAYSILKTGRDEYGQFLPLAFRSFDDYKPPLFIYLTIPSVAIFGLSEFAVRFPSALLGVLAIPIVFFLTRKLFQNATIAVAASFLLAISPWHTQFTRPAYETGANVFFTSLGLLFFLKGLEKWRYLLLAGFVFGLQTHLYQASKVFVPLFVSMLVVIYFHRFKFSKLLLLLAPLIVLFIPIFFSLVSPTGSLRFRGTSIFQDPLPHGRFIKLVTTDWLRNDNRSTRLFHPEILTFSQDIIIGYLSHFRPDFFLTSRENSRITYVPEVGLVNLWEFPFLLAGFYYIFRKYNKTIAVFLVGWFLLAPIPASVTTNLPNSTRTVLFLPVIQIITAVGLVSVTTLLPRVVRIFLAGVILYSLAFYTHMLFIHAPISGASNWYSGYKKMVLESLALSTKFKKVIVSTIFDQPQIFYLFYLRFDPATYLSQGGTTGGGFKEQGNHLANKYFFHEISWDKERLEPETLLVATPREIPIEAKDNIIGKYYSLDGQLIAYFVRTP